MSAEMYSFVLIHCHSLLHLGGGGCVFQDLRAYISHE